MENQGLVADGLTPVVGDIKDELPGFRLRPGTAEIQAWVVDFLVNEIEVDSAVVGTDVPFSHFGLSSASAVFLIGSLEDYLGRELDPTLPYDYPTIRALSDHLAATT
jgi:acyl carrier protein